MPGLVAFGDFVFLAIGFAAGYFAQPYVDKAMGWVVAAYDWIKAKF